MLVVELRSRIYDDICQTLIGLFDRAKFHFMQKVGHTRAFVFNGVSKAALIF